MTRDLLIGAVPPAAINDRGYVGVSLVAGAVIFLCYPNVKIRLMAIRRGWNLPAARLPVSS